jgi:hypothetical protein
MYKLINNRFNVLSSILRLSDGAFIPLDESNTDYKKYLEWVAAGNTPEPADE